MVKKLTLEELRALENEGINFVDEDGFELSSKDVLFRSKMKEKKFEEAEGFFKTVLELEPEDEIARQYLEFLSSRQ